MYGPHTKIGCAVVHYTYVLLLFVLLIYNIWFLNCEREARPAFCGLAKDTEADQSKPPDVSACGSGRFLANKLVNNERPLLRWPQSFRFEVRDSECCCWPRVDWTLTAPRCLQRPLTQFGYSFYKEANIDVAHNTQIFDMWLRKFTLLLFLYQWTSVPWLFPRGAATGPL